MNTQNGRFRINTRIPYNLDEIEIKHTDCYEEEKDHSIKLSMTSNSK